MKLLKLFAILLCTSNSATAQNEFELGVDYFNQGNLILADSCFTLYTEKFPDDINAVYNFSVTKLLLNDTCSFCEGIFSQNEIIEIDKNAVKMYFEHCGSTDTIFYNKNDAIVTGSKFKYFRVMEYHRCQESVIGKYHYKKPKNAVTRFSSHEIKDFKTDIFAVYQILPDNSKVYTYTESMPTFYDEDGAIWQYVLDSPICKQAKEELNLDNNTIEIEYIVHKDGRTSSISIVGSDLEIEKQDVLLKYLKQIFKEIPDYVPGKFNNEIVDYKLQETIII